MNECQKHYMHTLSAIIAFRWKLYIVVSNSSIKSNQIICFIIDYKKDLRMTIKTNKLVHTIWVFGGTHLIGCTIAIQSIFVFAGYCLQLLKTP